MATSSEIRDAAEAVVQATAAEEAARLALDELYAEAHTLIPTETAAYQAADNVYQTALEGAKDTVGYPAAASALTAATEAKEQALAALVTAMEQFGGS